MKKLLIAVLLAAVTVCIESKVLIFTYAYNRPDFIEKQHLTFERFLKDEYEFVVFNDAIRADAYQDIEDMCKKYNIRCVQIPQAIHKRHEPAERNCAVVKYSLEQVGFNHDDILVLLDSDLFLVSDFSFRDYMDGYDLAGIYQDRPNVHYLWIGLVMLNMTTMPNKNTINFDCGAINGSPVDAGGHSYYYLTNNPQARVRYIQQANLYNINQYVSNFPDKKTEYFVQQMTSSDLMVMNSALTFVHYRGATNWNNDSDLFHAQKTKIFNDYFDYLLKKNHRKYV